MRRIIHWTALVIGWLAVAISIGALIFASFDEPFAFTRIINAAFIAWLALLLIFAKPPKAKRRLRFSRKLR